MKKHTCRTAALLIAVVLFLNVKCYGVSGLSARSAILVDGTTGRVLWSMRENEKSLIASTTKIMTGLLVAQNCDLTAPVQIPEEAVGIEGSSMYLKEGEVLTVEALLYGMMLHSGNDAAVALALYHSGSLEDFTTAMNDMAEELGLHHTRFGNPHGLDGEDNYSTAADLARLTVYAMKDPVFYRVVSSKTAVFGQRHMTNHNKLLWRYPGAVGVKTGYTRAAGRILVSCAERDGRRLIAVTIHAPDDWQDHEKLLDHGFSVYSEEQMLSAGQIVGHVPVIAGAEDMAHAVAADDYVCLVSEREQVSYQLDLPQFVFAPLLAGERAGYVKILIDGIEIAAVPLYWRYSVLESG